MTSVLSNTLSPVLYLPHGGGPLPLLGDIAHEGLAEFLRKMGPELGAPSAILVISAHWEEKQPTLTSGSHPRLIYDYYGFPPESYQIQYPAPGAPELAQEIEQLFRSEGSALRLDEHRGFDHGVFVPLKLMYPEAKIPCLQLSLLNHLDPADHIALGKRLAPLRTKNVLIIGSGLSFHNLRNFFSRDSSSHQDSLLFDQWLVETCTGQTLSREEKEQRLIEWERAPRARNCHPREEHLLPLHVCFGAACAGTPEARLVFNQDLMGKRVSGFLW